MNAAYARQIGAAGSTVAGPVLYWRRRKTAAARGFRGAAPGWRRPLEADTSGAGSVIDRPIRQFIAELADPNHFSGGGAVAAVTLVETLATTRLVVSLALRRRSLAPRRAEIQAILDALEQLETELSGAADRDLAALAALLDAQRSARSADPTVKPEAQQLVEDALRRAAAEPATLADHALALLRLIRRAVPFATRFTVSDLGAAAAMAGGAVTASLLMSEVNLALLGDAPGLSELRDRVARLRQQAPAIAGEIVDLTRARLAGALPEEGPRVDRA